MRLSRRMGLLGSAGPLWLFDGDKGGDVTKVTGGWTRLLNPNGYYTSLAEVREDCLYFSHKRNDDRNNTASLTTTNLIDLSSATTLSCSAYRTVSSSYKDYGTMTMYVLDSSGSSVASVQLSKNVETTVTSLDISKLTGSYYVRLTISGTKNVAASIYNMVTKVWGE